MSRLRRLRQQRRVRTHLENVLAQYRELRWRWRIQRFCLWFLRDHRGYAVTDPITNECDRAVVGLMRWQLSGAPMTLRSVGHFIAESVRWA